MRGTVAIVRNDHSRYPEGGGHVGDLRFCLSLVLRADLWGTESVSLPAWNLRNTHGSDEIAPVSFFSKA